MRKIFYINKEIEVGNLSRYLQAMEKQERCDYRTENPTKMFPCKMDISIYLCSATRSPSEAASVRW
jgi:hypothetical protein